MYKVAPQTAATGAVPETAAHGPDYSTAEAAYGSRGLLVLLVCITGLGPLAMSSFIPAIPAIQEEFGVSRTLSQLTLSVSLFFMAAGSLVYGALADRLGRRPVILTGVALAVVGSVICALATNIWLVIIGRAIQASGSTVGFSLSRVVVRDVYGDEKSSSLLGYISAAMMLAPVMGPFIGGYLIEYFSWHYNFVVVGSIAAVLFVGLWLRLPETRPEGVEGDPQLVPWARFAELLRRRPYRRMVIYGAALQGTFMAFLAAAPYLITQYYGLPASSYGFYFFGVPLGFFVGSLIAARFGTLFTQRGLIFWGAAGSVVACALAFTLSTGIDVGPWGVFAPIALMTVAQASAYPALQVRLLTASQPHSGSGSGCFSAIQLMAGGVLAQLVGATLFLGVAGVTGIMLLCSAVAMWVVLTRRPEPAA